MNTHTRNRKLHFVKSMRCWQGLYLKHVEWCVCYAKLKTIYKSEHIIIIIMKSSQVTCTHKRITTCILLPNLFLAVGSEQTL